MRRTPGLRREEVAALAGVSIDYYTRLERDKEIRPSPAVTDSLARALKLDADEHEHLSVRVALERERGPRPLQVSSGPVSSGLATELGHWYGMFAGPRW